jgi:predicted dehydrogenase
MARAHRPRWSARLQRRGAYAAFAADIDNGTHTVPDFADAVRRHEVIAAIERSAASGERVTA